jgi:hypothetical protein
MFVLESRMPSKFVPALLACSLLPFSVALAADPHPFDVRDLIAF